MNNAPHSGKRINYKLLHTIGSHYKKYICDVTHSYITKSDFMLRLYITCNKYYLHIDEIKYCLYLAMLNTLYLVKEEKGLH